MKKYYKPQSSFYKSLKTRFKFNEEVFLKGSKLHSLTPDRNNPFEKSEKPCHLKNKGSKKYENQHVK